MRCYFAAVALIVSALSASAEQITLPSDGALFCEDIDQMKSLLESTIAGKPPEPPSSCTVLKPGVSIETIKIDNYGDSVKVGLGIVADGERAGKIGAFILVSKSGQAPSAAPPAEPRGPRTYKTVDALDIRATPGKWKNRDVEVKRVHVYWVEEGDIRVLLGGDVTLFVKTMNGRDWQHFKNECETAREAVSGKCLADARFRFYDHDEDKPNGYEKRTILTGTTVELSRVRKRR